MHNRNVNIHWIHMDKPKFIVITLLLILRIAFAGDLQVEQTSKIYSVVKSLIIPGLGQFDYDRPARGRFFMILEGSMWVGVAGCFYASNFENRQFKSFASEHAGVSTDGKSYQYWVDISNYSSLDNFNQEHLRWREFDALYPENKEWKWNWDSSKNQKRFKNMRIRSDQLALAGKFVIGAVVINHVVSAIDAIYLKRISEIKNVSLSSQFGFEANRVTYQICFKF